MDKMVVKYHDFENAKQEIKEFSEQTVTDIDLRRVDSSKSAGEAITDWLWGRGIGTDHIVKGAELNSVTSQVQECLQSVNATQIKLIKEFGQVYSALEALDKDYIQAILISIKATEKTSEGIQETQGQIGKIVENRVLKNEKSARSPSGRFFYLKVIISFHTAHRRPCGIRRARTSATTAH